MDVHDPVTRSYNMSKIRAKDTKPELLVRQFLHAKGFRYRIHVNDLPGKPDIVFPRLKTVIQVHGCFWHGHEGCKYFKIPQTRTKWWKEKIERNIRKDVENTEALHELGWKVLVLWECQLKGDNKNKTLQGLEKELKK